MTSLGMGGTRDSTVAASGGGHVRPQIGWKDYVDARDEATKATSDSALSRIEASFARMEGKFDSLPSTANLVVMLTSFLAVWLLVLALLGNYFGMGLSATRITQEIEYAQDRHAAAQNKTLQEMHDIVKQMRDQLQLSVGTSKTGGK